MAMANEFATSDLLRGFEHHQLAELSSASQVSIPSYLGGDFQVTPLGRPGATWWRPADTLPG